MPSKDDRDKPVRASSKYTIPVVLLIVVVAMFLAGVVYLFVTREKEPNEMKVYQPK